MRAVGHGEDGDAQPLDGVGGEARATDERDFFGQRHLGDQLIGALIGRAFGVLRLDDRSLGGDGVLRADGRGGRKNGQKGQAGRKGEFHKQV